VSDAIATPVLRDATTGAIWAGAAPTFVAYKSRAGVAQSQPAIAAAGPGVWGFRPTDADETLGVAFLLDCGAGVTPRYVSGPVCTASAPFEAFHLEDGAGALWTGAAPTLPTANYVDFTGALRTPPAVVTVHAACLFAFAPSAADISVDTAYRVDSPAGASPAYLAGSTLLVSAGSGLPPAVESTTVTVEDVATKALRKWLLQTLPAKCAELNLLRKAAVEAPLVGPYVVPVGAVLKVSTTGRDVGAVFYPLTAGSRSASQVAADINGVTPGLATVDSDGRVTLTSSTAPLAPSTSSVLNVMLDGTGANEALGLDAGGEFCIRTPLVAPTAAGVSIGEPPYTSMSKGLWIIIGDIESQLVESNPRRHEHLLSLDVTIMRADVNAANLNGREHVYAAVRAVREVLSTRDGRQFGRAGQGDIVLALEGNTRVSGRPIAFSSADKRLHFDGALMRLGIRVFNSAPL
jgi:hypothetical protein